MATRVSSIVVAGLTNDSPWVDHFVVECYSDSALTNLVGSSTSRAVPNIDENGAQFFEQIDLMEFHGLEWGDTYYLRAGTVSPVSGTITWTDPHPAVGGSVIGKLGTTFTVAGSPLSPSGIMFAVSPVNPPPDLQRYEAVWDYAGTPVAPDPNIQPRWDGGLSPDGFIRFTVDSTSMGAGSNSTFPVNVWMRAVSMTEVRENWFFVGTYNPGTLDHVADGTQFGKVNASAISGGNVDPRTSGVIKLGSINPYWSGSITFGANTAADGSSWVTWSWTTLFILLADNRTMVVPAGSITISGLVPQGSYYFFPFVDAFSSLTAGKLQFVGGDVGTGGMAWTANSNDAARAQGLQNHMPMSNGGIPVTTPAVPASGTSGGGGSGGGSGGCARFGQKVFEISHALIDVKHVKVGHQLLGEDGKFFRVTNVKHTPCDEWIRLTLRDGRQIEHTPDTAMKLEDGTVKRTYELAMQDMLTVREGNGAIKALELLHEFDYKAEITIEDPHWFFCGSTDADILAHNVLNKTQ